MREKLERRPAIRVVAIAHRLAHDLLGFAVFAFGDPLLGQFHAALAETGDGFFMLISCRQRVGQESDRDAVFIVRPAKSSPASRCSPGPSAACPCSTRGLASRHFLFRDAVHILRDGSASARTRRQEQARKMKEPGTARRSDHEVDGGGERAAAKMGSRATASRSGNLDLLVRLLSVDDDGFVGLDVEQLIFDLLQRFQ